MKRVKFLFLSTILISSVIININIDLNININLIWCNQYGLL